ncbi:hypothetical protein [Paraburkholderia elongata]|uniref:Uncharacterized protein n=1 Tax=Paraburkholderia elongata TaxID=2675747 RepID=A0A972NRA0_9BURK|nr:hypothetical protein [Paraburkholderia elongata]NPT57174.1 hypothetical protein [Paraburkholderia elongata]
MEKKRSRTRRQTSCPTIGALLRYRTRIVRVIAEARGQQAMIESLDTTGRTFVSRVKWGSLRDSAPSSSESGLHRRSSDDQP